MSSADLSKRLIAYFGAVPADPSARPDREAARALLEALAEEGVPEGSEELARRLIFDHLDLVQDHLPPDRAARLEALLEPAAALPPPRPSPALDARVLAAVAREAPLPPRPPVRPGWMGLAHLGAALALAVVVAAVAVSAWRSAAPQYFLTGPSPIEIRLDRASAAYHPGDTVFIQLAPSSAGHLALLVSTAARRPGVALADQSVAAGQVVISRLDASATTGPASLVAVLASDRLVGLTATIGRLPPPVDASALIKATEALARAQGVQVSFATKELTVVR